MNVSTILTLGLASLFLASCQIPAAMIATGAGAMPAYKPIPRPKYDAPPQVIYSIDKSRFFTSENYPKCSWGEVYYNDTDKNIKTPLGLGRATFPGRLLVDGNSDVLILPDSPSDGTGTCGNDKGCFFRIFYSMDGGKTFDWFHPWPLGGDRKIAYEKGRATTVILKGNHLFLSNGIKADRFIMEKGIRGGAEHVEGGPAAVPHVRTPSGQDRLTCDDSIHPKEVVR